MSEIEPPFPEGLKILYLHRQRALPGFECIICKRETSNDCNVCSNCPKPQKCMSKAHKDAELDIYEKKQKK